MSHEHFSRVARNTMFLTGAFVGQKVLSFFYFTLIARMIGAEETGRYFFALSLSTIFSIIVDLGLAPVLIREIAKKREQGLPFFHAMITLKSVFSICAYGSLALFIFLAIHDPQTRVFLFLAGILMVLDGWHLLFYGVMRGFEQLRYEAIGVVLGQLMTVFIGGVVLWVKLPLAFLFIALMSGSVVNILIAVISLVRVFHVPIRFRWNSGLVRTILHMAWPFALAGVFVKIYSYIDGVLLGMLIDHTHVGWYSVAFKITFALQFIPMAFAASLFPAMSAVARQSKEALARLFLQSSFLLLLLAFPVAFGIFSIADKIILAFYGEAYAAAIPALQILIFSLLFVFLGFPIGSLLNATDQQHRQTGAMGMSMLLNVGLNLFLIPKWTIFGAAVAALVSNAALVGIGMFWVRRTIPLHGDVWLHFFVKTVLSASVMTTAIMLLKPYLHFTFLIVLGGAVYIVMLFLVRAVSRETLRTIFTMLFRRGAPHPPSSLSS